MSVRALFDVPSPAKVNLFLHVVGRRPDGYHLLQSVFMLIDWCDVLHFERTHDGQVSREDIGPALPADDLVLRAARRLQEASGTSLGVRVSIDKRVPWGAGLGGGSSNAATTLLALNRLWGLNWPRSALLPLGLALGADVPFFLGGCNAWVEGVGERLTPITLPSATLAVLKPAASVPTAAIFGRPDLPRNTAPAIVADFLADPFGFGHNDLQATACMHDDLVNSLGFTHDTATGKESTGGIRLALALLERTFGASRMTGSGSAVFARAGDDAGATDSADKLARLLATVPQGWSGRLCQGMSEHPLRHWCREG